MAKLFATSGDPDQALYSVASDLGLLCLPLEMGQCRISENWKAVQFYLDFTPLTRWLESANFCMLPLPLLDKFSRQQIDDIFLIFPNISCKLSP